MKLISKESATGRIKLVSSHALSNEIISQEYQIFSTPQTPVRRQASSLYWCLLQYVLWENFSVDSYQLAARHYQ
jgi:hypothetical protein